MIYLKEFSFGKQLVQAQRQRVEARADDDYLLNAMSQRGADMLREDMDAMGPIKIKEVEGAQQQIIAVVRQLETEGIVSLKGAAGEQYVV